MNIVVCCKIVPDDQDIMVNADRTLNFSHANPSISTYDLNALEAAVVLAETCEAKVTAISVGGKGIDESKIKKNILSRGADELIMIADDALDDVDTHVTAFALKAALEKLDSYDLVICGDGSADRYAQQVGIQLGQLLSLPTLNAVTSLSVSGNELTVTRSLELQTETLVLSLPAVLSVTSDLNQPRIATMKQILAAGKKPTTMLGGEVVGSVQAASEKTEVLAPQEADRKREIIEGDSDDQIAAFVTVVKEAIR